MPQKNRIILIDHHDNPPDDRASLHLAARGFRLDWRRPVNGDELADLYVDDSDDVLSLLTCGILSFGSGDEIADDIAGCIIYGGSQNVDEAEKYPFLRDEIAWIRACHAQRIPLLGICLGAQLIAHALGGEVAPMPDGRCEFGYYPVTPTPTGADFMAREMVLTQAHFQRFTPPPDAVLLATGDAGDAQAFRLGKTTYATQFHPEVTRQILQRWQDSDWAFFDSPGAQPREKQTQLATEHDAKQHEWFIKFLDKLFV